MAMSYLQALAAAIRDAMAVDPRVIVMGARLGGQFITQETEAFAQTLRDYGDRFYTKVPIAEFGLAGAAVGAALSGARPLLSFNLASFMLHGFPPVVNEAPNVYYSTAGMSTAPVTWYAVGGLRGGGSSQHSHRLQSMVGGVPGLQVFTPAIPADAYGLLRWCLLESIEPTLFLSHSELLLATEEFSPTATLLPVGKARVCVEGGDVTIVAHSIAVRLALEAAEMLKSIDGISAEVVDLRTIVPLDERTLIESVTKTGRAVIVDECHKTFGVNAEVAARLSSGCFDRLEAPVCRVATEDVPVPYNKGLERAISITTEKIVEGARSTMKYRVRRRA